LPLDCGYEKCEKRREAIHVDASSYFGVKKVGTLIYGGAPVP
jgi:hypothetical protein